jgi:hypothetical protein
MKEKVLELGVLTFTYDGDDVLITEEYESDRIRVPAADLPKLAEWLKSLEGCACLK